MIKAEELRRLNYIYSKDGCIRQVMDFKEDTYRYKLSNGNILKHHLKTANPIPLTEEMLLDMGFNKQNHNEREVYFKYLGYGVNYIVIDISTLPYISLGDLSEGFKVCIDAYIHNIQNLFYSLTGKDLQITKT